MAQEVELKDVMDSLLRARDKKLGGLETGQKLLKCEYTFAEKESY